MSPTFYHIRKEFSAMKKEKKRDLVKASYKNYNVIAAGRDRILMERETCQEENKLDAISIERIMRGHQYLLQDVASFELNPEEFNNKIFFDILNTEDLIFRGFNGLSNGFDYSNSPNKEFVASVLTTRYTFTLDLLTNLYSIGALALHHKTPYNSFCRTYNIRFTTFGELLCFSCSKLTLEQVELITKVLSRCSIMYNNHNGQNIIFRLELADRRILKISDMMSSKVMKRFKLKALSFNDTFGFNEVGLDELFIPDTTPVIIDCNPDTVEETTFVDMMHDFESLHERSIYKRLI